MGFTSDIVESILNTTYGQLPKEAFDTVKNCFLDTVGGVRRILGHHYFASVFALK